MRGEYGVQIQWEVILLSINDIDRHQKMPVVEGGKGYEKKYQKNHIY